MSNSTPPRTPSVAGERAAAWLLALEADRLSPSERAEFIDWLRESPGNVAEMLHIGRLHRALSLYPKWKDLAPMVPGTEGRVVPFPAVRDAESLFKHAPLPTPRRAILRVAALLLVTVAFGAYFVANFGQRVYLTQLGEHHEVELADGSVLEIAPGSELRVHLRARERDVYMERGAALFRVAHDASRPFIVSTPYGDARAVGTAFSVDRRGKYMVVTVVEGRVAVSGQRGEVISLTGLGAGGSSAPAGVTLGANQQVKISASGSVAPVREIDANQEVSWAYGQLLFKNETVGEVAAQFNQYNRTQIQVIDPALAVQRISGNFRASDPDSFVDFVHSVAGAQVARNSAGMIVIGTTGTATHPASTQ